MLTLVMRDGRHLVFATGAMSGLDLSELTREMNVKDAQEDAFTGMPLGDTHVCVRVDEILALIVAPEDSENAIRVAAPPVAPPVPVSEGRRRVRVTAREANGQLAEAQIEPV